MPVYYFAQMLILGGIKQLNIRINICTLLNVPIPRMKRGFQT